jgi:hypothetical protein
MRPIPDGVLGRYIYLLQYVFPVWWLGILFPVGLFWWAGAVPSVRKRLDRRSRTLLWSSIGAPFVPLIWAAIAYGWGREGSQWAERFMLALYVLVVGLGTWTGYSIRRVPWIAFSIILYVFVYSAILSIPGGMMIANDWAWF